MCAFLLHMTIVKEVKTALGLMEFVKNNSTRFKGKGPIYPFMVSIMKFIGGFTTEMLSMVIIVQSQSVGDVVSGFVSFGILAEIDDMMAFTLQFSVSEEIAKMNVTFNEN